MFRTLKSLFGLSQNGADPKANNSNEAPTPQARQASTPQRDASDHAAPRDNEVDFFDENVFDNKNDNLSWRPTPIPAPAAPVPAPRTKTPATVVRTPAPIVGEALRVHFPTAVNAASASLRAPFPSTRPSAPVPVRDVSADPAERSRPAPPLVTARRGPPRSARRLFATPATSAPAASLAPVASSVSFSELVLARESRRARIEDEPHRAGLPLEIVASAAFTAPPAGAESGRGVDALRFLLAAEAEARNVPVSAGVGVRVLAKDDKALADAWALADAIAASRRNKPVPDSKPVSAPPATPARTKRIRDPSPAQTLRPVRAQPQVPLPPARSRSRFAAKEDAPPMTRGRSRSSLRPPHSPSAPTAPKPAPVTVQQRRPSPRARAPLPPITPARGPARTPVPASLAHQKSKRARSSTPVPAPPAAAARPSTRATPTFSAALLAQAKLFPMGVTPEPVIAPPKPTVHTRADAGRKQSPPRLAPSPAKVRVATPVHASPAVVEEEPASPPSPAPAPERALPVPASVTAALARFIAKPAGPRALVAAPAATVPVPEPATAAVPSPSRSEPRRLSVLPASPRTVLRTLALSGVVANREVLSADGSTAHDEFLVWNAAESRGAWRAWDSFLEKEYHGYARIAKNMGIRHH